MIRERERETVNTLLLRCERCRRWGRVNVIDTLAAAVSGGLSLSSPVLWLWSQRRVSVFSAGCCSSQSSVVMLFYPRDATHVFATATCPFVCPSVTTGIVSSTAKAGSLNVHHLIAPWIHFLKRYDSSKNSQWVTPNGRAKWDWSRFLGDFRQKCRHISKTVHFRHQKNYYRMVIGNHMQTIEWCHFRCPWVTHDPDFNSVARVCQLQQGFLVTTVSK